MAESETPPEAAAPPAEDNLDALEASDDESSSLESGGTSSDTIDATSDSAKKPAAPGPEKDGLKNSLRKFNLYLLLFVFIIVVALLILAVAYFQSKKASTTSTVKSQALTQKLLQDVASSDATVGNTQQILNVQSSAVFAGKVLVRDGLEVATGLQVGGNLQVGGTATITSLAVSGTAQFGQTQVTKDFSVAGDTAVQGALTVAKTLQVTGGGTFSGPLSAPQVTTSNLQLNSDLILTHHITAGGATPKLANGSALGGGGTASVSGSDTSGSVSINIGNGAVAGCFATITFNARFNATPHVVLTPTSVDSPNASAGVIDYYVTRTTGSFSICDSTTPPSGGSFGFDYFIVD